MNLENEFWVKKKLLFMNVSRNDTRAHVNVHSFLCVTKNNTCAWICGVRASHSLSCVVYYFFLNIISSAGICVANVLYISVLAVPLSWIASYFQIVAKYFYKKKENKNFFLKFRVLLLYFCVLYIVTPTHEDKKGRKKKYFYWKKNQFLPYVLTGSKKKRKIGKKKFILCRVLFSLHVAPMCIVCDAVYRRECFF